MCAWKRTLPFHEIRAESNRQNNSKKHKVHFNVNVRHWGARVSQQEAGSWDLVWRWRSQKACGMACQTAHQNWWACLTFLHYSPLLSPFPFCPEHTDLTSYSGCCSLAKIRLEFLENKFTIWLSSLRRPSHCGYGGSFNSNRTNLPPPSPSIS